MHETRCGERRVVAGTEKGVTIQTFGIGGKYKWGSRGKKDKKPDGKGGIGKKKGAVEQSWDKGSGKKRQVVGR